MINEFKSAVDSQAHEAVAEFHSALAQLERLDLLEREDDKEDDGRLNQNEELLQGARQHFTRAMDIFATAAATCERFRDGFVETDTELIVLLARDIRGFRQLRRRMRDIITQIDTGNLPSQESIHAAMTEMRQ